MCINIFNLKFFLHFKNLHLIHKFILHLIITLKYSLCRDIVETVENDCIFYKAKDIFVYCVQFKN